ncbi:MAG: hypothetical protein Q7J82_08745 [Coriobacteriia bacterium]|nr:hypothetical protein [Coriobacteriia bacterium]
MQESRPLGDGDRPSGLGSAGNLARTLIIGWAAVGALALATWFADPNFQHVLMFASGGLWGLGVVFVFARSRKDTGRHTPVWVFVLAGVPLVAFLALCIALTWEVLSPMAVPLSTPFRLFELWAAFALGRLGSKRMAEQNATVVS